jgi:uncharacterized protein YggE
MSKLGNLNHNQFGARLAAWGQLPLTLALLIIIGLLLIWKPWDSAANATDRTITVTGEAEITAAPDEYIFMPQYQFKASDKAVALQQATDKTNSVIRHLKDLGVADSKIKADTNGYGSFLSDGQDTYYATVTVTVGDKVTAQKVQDYLLTTEPTGSVTPQADFSKTRRRQLINQARDHATQDAQAQAEQSARNLGFKIGKVKSVVDNPDSNGPIRLLESGNAVAADGAASSSVAQAPLQPGENKLTYQVKVTYFVR